MNVRTGLARLRYCSICFWYVGDVVLGGADAVFELVGPIVTQTCALCEVTLPR